MIHYSEIETPIGTMALFAGPAGIVHASFGNIGGEKEKLKTNKDYIDEEFTAEKNDHLALLEDELGRYFSGSLKEFTVAKDLRSTEFRIRVWELLCTIKYGDTITYLKQSELAGNRLSIRAVASANAKNPVAIVIPCHRVIGTDGRLTGYAGGLWRKEWLLRHEQKYSGKGSYLRLFE